VHCALRRTVVRYAANSWPLKQVSTGPELAKSQLSELQRRGRVLFRTGGNVKLSRRGALACASCHPEGRTDGLSWLIHGKVLQTPVLAGRLVGTQPFKWDGGDQTLEISLRTTVTRLGGRGLSRDEAKALAAYISALPRPRAPRPHDTAAVARGSRLFHSRTLKCSSCHSGRLLTNGKRYDLATDLARVDTPSLIGLAMSAPYYHDGSASNLRALLMDNGSVHGMARLKRLSRRDIADLIAYLKTL